MADLTPEEIAEKREEVVQSLMATGITREKAVAQMQFIGYALGRRFGDREVMPAAEKEALIDAAFGPISPNTREGNDSV